MKTLDGGTRVYQEGRVLVEPKPNTFLPAADWQRAVQLVRLQSRDLASTPLEQCRRVLWLVERNGRVSWRALLFVDLSQVTVFTGRSLPVRQADISPREDFIIKRLRFDVDYEPGEAEPAPFIAQEVDE